MGNESPTENAAFVNRLSVASSRRPAMTLIASNVVRLLRSGAIDAFGAQGEVATFIVLVALPAGAMVPPDRPVTGVALPVAPVPARYWRTSIRPLAAVTTRAGVGEANMEFSVA